MENTWLMLPARQQQHLSVCTSLGRFYPSKITLDSGNRMNEKNNTGKKNWRAEYSPVKKEKHVISCTKVDKEWTIVPMAQYVGKGVSVKKPRVVFVVIHDNLNWQYCSLKLHESQQNTQKIDICPIHVVKFYIKFGDRLYSKEKRRAWSGLFPFEYMSSVSKIDINCLPLHGPGNILCPLCLWKYST